MAVEPTPLELPRHVIAAIHVAFTSPPPPRVTLFAPGADDGEAADIRRALRGRRWTAVSRQVALSERSALNWLAPTARHHYLPLWLLAAGRDGLVRLWTVEFLLRVAESREFQAIDAGLYTPAERAAVAAFLHWVAAADSAVAGSAGRALAWWGRS